ncbi:LCP family protein [Streptomyces collinus]|uniref:LCP family protein required for cell wall assembly n=1 Tax=Streptomyces collinus TaxID=42684 RepID=A0AA89Q264_STRCU|nr:LCP family protein [Streptomyces collinus]MBB5811530.1 LCP family protein required for cell wall assembly [Streptomyces collinus]WMX64753.1 LCP family protein [Streptomyces collinus]
MAQSDVRGGGTRRESGGGLAQDERPGTAASAAGGGAEGGGGQGRRRGRRRGGGRRIVRWFALVLSVLILGTAGAGYLYYRHLNGNIDKGKRNSGESDVEKTGPNAAGQTPLNILLIGSDSRNSAENLKLGGSRDNVGSKPLADVQMLLHVSADRESASVVSIPRDTRVDIPKCVDPDTGETYPAKNTIINETLQRGGPGCTLATWQNLTGVYIDHWMMVDFAGVVDMADAVGGVPVCVNQNVWDRPLSGQRGGSGLKLKAGTHKVQGKEALQWLRTRHAWGSDPLRAKAQHMYMNAMIRTLKEQNVFTDTGRLMGLAEAGTKALTVSEEIGTVKELYDVGMQLKSVPTNRITMTTMPWIEDPLNRNHLVPKPEDADKMWAMLRDDVSFDKAGKARAATAPGPSPASVKATGPAAAPAAGLSVTVVNGTASDERPAVPQRAAAIVAALQQEGFTQAVAASRQDPHARTQVTYPKSTGEQGRANALSVAKAVGIPSSQVRATDDVTTTLTIGSDWREGTAYPEQKAPKAGDLPDSADALSADKPECMDVYRPYRW